MKCTYSVINNIAHSYHDSGGTTVTSDVSIMKNVIGGVKTLTDQTLANVTYTCTLVMVCDIYV